MDAWGICRTGTGAEPGLMSTSMSSPEEELAAVLQRTGCGRNEVVSFTAINKMFQRQVNPAPAHTYDRTPITVDHLGRAGAAAGHTAFAAGAKPAGVVKLVVQFQFSQFNCRLARWFI